MRYSMLVRYNIKNVSSAEIRTVAESCGRATLIISPTHNNLWNINICLKEEEIQKIRALGFNYEKVPG